MEFEFECVCGERISEFTRGPNDEVPGRSVVCDDCDARYIVTITLINQGTRDGTDPSVE